MELPHVLLLYNLFIKIFAAIPFCYEKPVNRLFMAGSTVTAYPETGACGLKMCYMNYMGDRGWLEHF